MSALSFSPDLFSQAQPLPMFRSSEKSMVHSAPSKGRNDSQTGTSVRERVLGFLDNLHPVGMAKRVCADTMKATRGQGISANTISQWRKRDCDPSAGHLDTLAKTYDLDFLAAVYPNVPGLMLAAQRARTDRLTEQLRAESAETERLLTIARGGR